MLKRMKFWILYLHLGDVTPVATGPLRQWKFLLFYYKNSFTIQVFTDKKVDIRQNNCKLCNKKAKKFEVQIFKHIFCHLIWIKTDAVCKHHFTALAACGLFTVWSINLLDKDIVFVVLHLHLHSEF